jgi:hypothetical protein
LSLLDWMLTMLDEEGGHCGRGVSVDRAEVKGRRGHHSRIRLVSTFVLAGEQAVDGLRLFARQRGNSC